MAKRNLVWNSKKYVDFLARRKRDLKKSGFDTIEIHFSDYLIVKTAFERISKIKVNNRIIYEVNFDG